MPSLAFLETEPQNNGFVPPSFSTTDVVKNGGTSMCRTGTSKKGTSNF